MKNLNLPAMALLIAVNLGAVWFVARQPVAAVDRSIKAVAEKEEAIDASMKTLQATLRRVQAEFSLVTGRVEVIEGFNAASERLARERDDRDRGCENALGMAETARLAGDDDLACTYAVNAIAHRGAEAGIESFHAYFKLITASSRSAEWKLGHLERLERLVVGAVAGVRATDVRAMVTLAGEVRKAGDAVRAQIAVPDEEEPQKAEPELDKGQVARENMERLVRRIGLLRQKMKTGPAADRELLVGMIREAHQGVVAIYSALVGEEDREVDDAARTACARIHSEAKRAMDELERELSEPLYEKVLDGVARITDACGKVADGASAQPDGSITALMADIGRRVGDLRAEALRITDPEMAQKAAVLLAGNAAAAQESLVRKRMEAYQQFAIGQIRHAAAIYDKYGSKFDDDKKDANMREAWSYLKDVAPGLLVPEVGEFYSSVWAKLFNAYADGQNGPLDGMQGKSGLEKSTRWKIQRALARGKRLEDF